MLYLLQLLIKLYFSGIKSINTAKLARWLNDEASQIPLLPSRCKKTYNVA